MPGQIEIGQKLNLVQANLAIPFFSWFTEINILSLSALKGFPPSGGFPNALGFALFSIEAETEFRNFSAFIPESWIYMILLMKKENRRIYFKSFIPHMPYSMIELCLKHTFSWNNGGSARWAIEAGYS